MSYSSQETRRSGMKRMIGLRVVCLSVVAVSLGVTARPAASQTEPASQTAPSAARHTIPALLVSDIHFDPFHDPGKAARLVDAPASEWNAILAEPPSPDQATAFAGVPVYVALGNNDSGCGDNRLDGGSDFLAAVGKDIVAGLPGTMSSKER